MWSTTSLYALTGLEVGLSVGAERGACSVVEVFVAGSSMGVGTCSVVEA